MGGFVTIDTWVVLNDIQIPWQDKPVLDMVLRFIEALKPRGVVLNGDVVDCYELSDFDKDPLKDWSLDREVAEAGRLMLRLSKVVKEGWWLGGNHEDRLRRVLWQNPKFARLRDLQFPALFHIADHGFRWKPYGGHVKLGKLIVTHGSLIRQHSGWAGRANFEKYGSSILTGHTHRLGVYYRTNARGTHAAYENGCLCKLTPEYVQFPDWQQGFSVVHVAPSGWFHVDQIPILQRRRFVYGGEVFER